MIPVSCDPEGKLDRVPLDQIEEFQGNLKSLGKTEYAKLKQSITEKGFVVPCFAWRNGSGRWKLLDGHQRVRVIRNEGWEIDGGIPIVEIAAEDERDAKEKLLAIVSRYGRVEGQGLYEFLDGTGIDMEQWAVPDLPDLDLDAWLDEFMRDPEVPQGDPEAVPEVPEEPTTQPGDLWVLGNHRVLCGDATSVDDVEKLMGGEQKINSIVSDPPYGIGYVGPGWMTGNKKNAIKNDEGANFQTAIKESFANFYSHLSVPSLHWIFVPGGRNIGIACNVADMMVGYDLNNLCVWDKDDLGMGQLLRNQWEGILLMAVGDGITSVWNGGHSTPNLFSQTVGRPQVGDHPTPKPPALCEKLIQFSTSIDHLIADPFLGSGTTLIAAEKQGRRCFGLEIEPKYVDVIVKRWEDYTGKTAVLEQSKAA